MITWRDVEPEVLSGLPNHRYELDVALYNLEFYHADFARWPYRAEDTPFGRKRFERTAPVMRRIVNLMTEDLYRAPPVRTIQDDEEATKWLADVYKANHVDAVWQKADAMTCVGDFAAIQVEGTTDPESPLNFVLWDASELVVWTDRDRRTMPAAVATIDRFDNVRRLRLWTADNVVEYRTEKLAPKQTADGTAYRRFSVAPNPYAPVLPFAFAHYYFPVVEFDSGGPGFSLRQANDYINFRLTEIGDNLRYYGRPVAIAEGVHPGWRPPAPPKPGEWLDIPPSALSAAGVGPSPSLRYLQADLSVVAAEWLDLNNYLDLALIANDVPPGAVRMSLSANAQSGVSIVAERAPLLGRAVVRRKPFGVYEEDLKKVALHVGGTWWGKPQLLKAVDAPYHLRWPPLDDSLPGPERDRQDDWRLAKGFVSRTMLLMEREGLTREEAESRLEEVAEDKAREAELGIGVSPVAAPPPMKASATIDEEPESSGEVAALKEDDGTSPSEEEPDNE